MKLYQIKYLIYLINTFRNVQLPYAFTIMMNRLETVELRHKLEFWDLFFFGGRSS